MLDSTHTYALPSNLQRKQSVAQSGISRNGYKQPVQQHGPYNLLPTITKKNNDSCARVRPFVPSPKNGIKIQQSVTNFKNQNNVIPPHHNYYQASNMAFQGPLQPVTRRVQLQYPNTSSTTNMSTSSTVLSRPVSFSTAQQSPQMWQNNGNLMQYTTHHGLNGQPLAKVPRRLASSPLQQQMIMNGSGQIMGHQPFTNAQGSQFPRAYNSKPQQGTPSGSIMRTIFVRKKY